MIQLLSLLIIVAAEPGAPTEQRDPEATMVFQCLFDEAADANFDGWPDGWTRRVGHGFPHYLNVTIDTPAPPPGGRSLRFNLDGGGAVALSPPIPVTPDYDWILEGYVRTKDLVHDRAFFSVTFLDERRQPLSSVQSEQARDTTWKKIRLGPLSLPSDAARFVVLGLHLEPEQAGRHEDLHGSAWFGDVWLARLPRMILSTGHPLNLFDHRDNVDITCRVLGLNAVDPRVKLELQDVFGQRVAEGEERLTSTPGRPERVVHWRPAIAGPGFYRVTARMEGPHQNRVYQRTLALAVVEPLPGDVAGEFGWSLSQGLGGLSPSAMTELLAHAGVSWVKYPIWNGVVDKPGEGRTPAGSLSLAQLAAWHGQLAARGIEMVGLLAAPTAERSRAGGPPAPLAADVFSADPATWSPAVEPILRQLGTQVRWWQLGADRDTSFVDFPNLLAKAQQIKLAMARLGSDVELGIGWNWLNQLPTVPAVQPPWQFLTLSADPPLTPAELGEYLDAAAGAGLRRWVTLDPLPRHTYSLEVRAADLVQQMITARIHKAEGIFVDDPFDAERGLVASDGAPSELLLAWRTTCSLLSGSTYLGRVTLPNASHNEIFSRPGDAVMVVWSDHPTQETLYLGESVRQFDLWGRSSTPERRPQGQVLHVGRLPIFLTGVSPAVVRWCTEFKLGRTSISSIFGQPQPNTVTWKNTFAQRVTGRADLFGPDQWTIEPRQVQFHLESGEEFRFPFRVTLPNDVTAGRHRIRVEFTIQAERPYEFSSYGQVAVGLEDVRLEIATRLNGRGEMEVEQRFINDSGRPVSYRCQLFAPGRQRQKFDLVGLPPGLDVKVFRLPDGEKLVGKRLWVRAEEINGRRALNYRVIAEP